MTTLSIKLLQALVVSGVLSSQSSYCTLVIVSVEPSAFGAPSGPGWTDRCKAREFRCELRCNEVTQGGSMKRLACYDECREEEQECRRWR